MSKLGAEDTLQTAIVKLAGGNPGAVTVCVELLKKGEQVDSKAGGLPYLIALDSFGIYGPRIWMLYKDVCKHSILSTMSTLRAAITGLVTEAELNRAIDNRGRGLDVEKVIAQVRATDPEFADIHAQLAEDL